MPTYPDFFRAPTGHPPYPYQDRLAQGAWTTLLDIPTGLGKTAADSAALAGAMPALVEGARECFASPATTRVVFTKG